MTSLPSSIAPSERGHDGQEDATRSAQPRVGYVPVEVCVLGGMTGNRGMLRVCRLAELDAHFQQLRSKVQSDSQPDLGTFCSDETTPSVSEMCGKFLEMSLRGVLQARAAGKPPMEGENLIKPLISSAFEKVRVISIRMCPTLLG